MAPPFQVASQPLHAVPSIAETFPLPPAAPLAMDPDADLLVLRESMHAAFISESEVFLQDIDVLEDLQPADPNVVTTTRGFHPLYSRKRQNTAQYYEVLNTDLGYEVLNGLHEYDAGFFSVGKTLSNTVGLPSNVLPDLGGTFRRDMYTQNHTPNRGYRSISRGPTMEYARQTWWDSLLDCYSDDPVEAADKVIQDITFL